MVLGFTAIGSYERLEQLGQVSLWNDEAQSTLVAFSILQHGYPVIVSRHLIDNWEPLYPYLEALSIRLLGDSDFAYRLPSALLGIALIPVSYLVGARLRDRYVGIAFAGMVAFSTEYIAWSRQARWYILLVLLMALGFWAALTWYQSRPSRARRLCVAAMVVLAVLSAAAGLGVFLLYVPGMVAAALVYLAASHWDAVRRFFGRPPKNAPGAVVPPARFVPYPYRLPLVIALIAALVVAALAEPGGFRAFYTASLTLVLGFPPFPLLWSPNIPGYLLNYYPGILVAAIVGGAFILQRRDPFDLALVTLCIVSFFVVTVGPSAANDIAGGGVSFPRHLFPLLYFLFLLASVGLAELLQRAYRAFPRTLRWPRSARAVTPVLFGVAVVAMLVLPGVVVPSGQTLYSRTQASPVGSLIPWVAFSLNPAYPSALYDTDQANYQRATDYVMAHRNATDVIAATSCGPPAVYLGHVQYWVRANARPGTIIYVDGQPEFQQTNSVLISNTSQLENVLFTSTGWLVSDQPSTSQAVLPDGMGLVLDNFMTEIPAGSDNSIWLYHWNRSTPVGLLGMLSERQPSLQNLGKNLTRLANWATVTGVTSSSFRGLLLPMETALLPYVAPGYLPLSVLVNVYNHRPDLQLEFPQMLQNASNDTLLVQWAYEVASGQLPDPAGPVLAPYASWYRSHE